LQAITRNKTNFSMRIHNIIIIACLSVLFAGCCDQKSQQPKPLFQYDRWTVSEPILQAGPPGSFDDIAVKDPCMVYYNGKYHLFYTSKFTRETAEKMQEAGIPVPRSRSGTGYVSAPTLEELKYATRYNLSEIVNEIVIAPQVFYFEPHGLWYIIAHRNVGLTRIRVPIYLTNPDIEDVHGWSEAKDLLALPEDGLDSWIDFRVICDEEKAHLFYTDHRGSLFRIECPLEDFPEGFEQSRQERLRAGRDHGPAHTVLTEWDEDEKGFWRLHEAVRVYHVTEADKYLAVAEAIRIHPTRAPYWDSRNRFMFALEADKIEGPWRRVERHKNDFAGDPDNLYNEDGTPSSYDQVSHFSLLRPGYDQKMELDNFNLQLVFQAFDAEHTPDDFNYDDLPWEIAIMRNY
jgi:hypothetical protein